MQAKIVLIGEATVGKSTIRERYLGISFRPSYLQTVGADYTMKEQILDDNTSVMLQIWDLAGQQGFSHIRESFYKGTDGVVIVFDVTKPATAEKIKDWIKEIRNKHLRVPILLVGNKIDLRNETNKSLTFVQGLKLAKKLSQSFKVPIQYVESSAKTGENIELIFSSIAVPVIEKINLQNKSTENGTDFTKYFSEYDENIQLFFFKMHDDGPLCSAKTKEEGMNEEILTKMAIYYATSLGQGASEHTGLFGPFPIPVAGDDEEKHVKSTDKSIIYSFKKLDPTLTDERAKGLNYCFIVITTPNDFVYQLTTNSVNRFFYDRMTQIEDVTLINDEFLIDLKRDLLNDVFLLSS